MRISKMSTQLVGIFLLSIGLADAQNPPMITGGPVNAASYVLAGLPNANIAQGSMFILFGQSMGPINIASASAFPLQPKLGGTSIQAKVGGTAVDAIMLYAVSSQVAAILPSNTPVGSGTLTLTFGGQTSNTVPIHVVPSSFGAFTRNNGGSGPGILFNFNTEADQPVNSLVVAAHPGQVLTLWGTGLGPVSGNEAAGPLPGNLDVPVDVYVGSTRVDAAYKGRSGCCAGIDQIVFTVPPGAAGCYVSVTVRAGGVTSNISTIAVTSSGTVCSDPAGYSVTDLQKLQSNPNFSVARASLLRASAKLSIPGMGPLQGNLDNVSVKFNRYTSTDALAAQLGGLGGLGQSPSLGSCTVSQFTVGGNLFDAFLSGSGDPVPSQSGDAGAAVNINGPLGAKQLPRQGNPQNGFSYKAPMDIIGGGIPPLFDSGQPDYLDPGDYTLDNGAGGAQVGAFLAKLTIPSNTFVWTNEDALNNIPRSQDLTVTWSGAASGGVVVILGSAGDPSLGVGAQFICLAPANAGSFTVLSPVLSAMPASGLSTGKTAGVPMGFLSVATGPPQPTRFQATSGTAFDVGFFVWGLLLTKNVNFQ